MRFPLKMAALALPLLVAACTTMPSGPGVMVLPGASKSFAQFRTDDMECRNYALESVGGVTSSQAATESGVGSAVVGTVVGAAAGAAIGVTSLSKKRRPCLSVFQFPERNPFSGNRNSGTVNNIGEQRYRQPWMQ